LRKKLKTLFIKIGIIFTSFLILFVSESVLNDTPVLHAQEIRKLSGMAKNLDKNNNNLIERSEARGPVSSNFDVIDKDKSGSLNGTELFNFFRGGAGKKKNRGGPKANVVVDAVIEEVTTQTVPVLGRVVSNEFGPVATRISGPVKKIYVGVGDRVKTGQLLAELDTEILLVERDRNEAIVSQQIARLDSAKADLEKRNLELNRLEVIRKSSSFSQAKYLEVIQEVVKQTSKVGETAAQLLQAQAQLKRSIINLKDSQIRSPYPGVVSTKYTEVGAFLKIGNPVVGLINDKSVMVEAEVPHAKLGKLKPGYTLQLTLNGEDFHKASVHAVIPDENARTRTRMVRFKPDFSSLNLSLAANQNVTLNVPIGRGSKVITVSKDAVLQRDGVNKVFLVRNQQSIPKTVKLGQSIGNRFVVLSGLKLGDSVVIRGNENLRPGQSVRLSSD
jgi:RND family efflux transporter MFP subunit